MSAHTSVRRMVTESACPKSVQLVLVMAVAFTLPVLAVWFQIDAFVPQPDIEPPPVDGVPGVNGAALALLIVVESLLFVGYLKLKDRLPVSPLTIVLVSGLVFHAIMVAAVTHSTGSFPWLRAALPYAWLVLGPIPVIGFVLLHIRFERRMRWWFVHNTLAFAIAATAAIYMGSFLPPASILAALAVLVVWDIIAVDLTDIMERLLSGSANIFVPNYIILPNRSKVDYWALEEFLSDDRPTPPQSLNGLLGLGDVVFPAALVVALVQSSQYAVAVAVAAGVLVSVVAMTGYQRTADRDMLPALPWVAGGCLAGWATITLMAVFA